MKNKHRQFRMAVKSLQDDGTFEGLLSPYNNVDDGGDLVEPGAFTKTLKENGNTIPALWQHKTDCPIGELTLDDRADGLWCKGKLLLEIPEAKKAYLLMKAKVVRGLSIGYDTIKSQVVDDVRRLKEIRLWEGSVVTFPMNLRAQIADVKARGEAKGDFNEELNERQLYDARYQMLGALSDALSTVMWEGDLARPDMVSAVETIIEQFHGAYMEYFPQYLDMMIERYGLDIKSWPARRETKEGRKLSSATKGSLEEAHEHMKRAKEILSALIDDEAGEDDESEDATSKSGAAAQLKSEPDELHSAAESIDEMMALLRA